MTARAPGAARARALWRRAALTWLALAALLVATLVGAYLPLGPWKTPVALAIAVAKGGIVAWTFMELSDARAIERFAAAAGILFLLVLFGATFADEATRSHAPGAFPAAEGLRNPGRPG